MTAYALATGAYGGLYKTTDGGMNWKQADKIAPPTNEIIAPHPAGRRRNDLRQHPPHRRHGRRFVQAFRHGNDLDGV